MIHAVFESTSLRATHFARRIFDCVCDVDIDNGTFGYMMELVEPNVYKFVPGTTEGKFVVVANQPAWSEDECRRTNQRRDKFFIPAGTRFRAFMIDDQDEFGISIDGITAATQSVVTGETDFMAHDVFLTIDTSTGKLVASTSSTDDAVMEARIERKRIVGGTLVTPVREYGYSQAIYEARVTTLA